MENENIRVELQKVADELDLLYRLTVEDYLNEKSRYYIGVLAGIDYARMELTKLVKGLKGEHAANQEYYRDNLTSDQRV